jgi:hypothetical protein
MARNMLNTLQAKGLLRLRLYKNLWRVVAMAAGDMEKLMFVGG